MLEKHNSAKGEMLIAEMKTDHIINSIKYALKRVSKEVTSNPKLAKMYGIKGKTDEQVWEEQKKCVKMLYPYLAELYFRKSTPDDEIISMLGELIGRENQFEVKMLPPEPYAYLSDDLDQFEQIPEDEIPF
jgi:hypothetical protein